MPFEIEDYVRLRPYVYHLTDSRNVSTLADHRLLRPSAEILKSAGKSEWIRRRRRDMLPVDIDGRTVVLKDQRPLVLANVELGHGWTSEDFIEHLNQHVFFWPGNALGPVKHGERVFDAYAGGGASILRVSAAALFEANPRLEPLFCAFNSGAPRMNDGRRAQRGPELFASPSTFARKAYEAVELVFKGTVVLPKDTSVRTPDGAWRDL